MTVLTVSCIHHQVFGGQYIVYKVQCIANNVPCIMFTVHCIQNIKYCVIYTVFVYYTLNI